MATEFAYLDKYGILHAHPVEETAKKYAGWNGKVAKTDLAEDGGYIKLHGETVFAYADEKKVLIGGNTPDHGGREVKFEDLPGNLKELLIAVGF